jgi:hypothetical protein
MRLDNSVRTTYNSCKKKFYYEYIMNLKPVVGSTSLRYGITWHAAMDKYYSTIKEGQKAEIPPLNAAILEAKKTWDSESSKFEFIEDYRTLQNLIYSLMEFSSFFTQDIYDLEILEVENNFEVPIGYIENSEEVIYTGRIDLLVKTGGIWVFDHKTTSQPLYLQKERLNRSAQFMGYVWASQETHERVDGAMINFHYLYSKKKKDGEYGKLTIDFDRVPQMYTQSDILNWKNHVFDIAHQIRESVDNNDFPMNPDHCYVYGKCPYCVICENTHLYDVEAEIPPGFKETENWKAFSL